MKRANGCGSIYKLKDGNRRRRWVVKISYYAEDYKLKQKAIGYFCTQKEALQALDNYNRNPYDVSAYKITFGEIFEKWSSREFKRASPQKCGSYSAAFKKCVALSSMPIQKIKISHLQETLDGMEGMSASSINNVKIIIKSIYSYALKYEYIDRDLSQYLETPIAKDKKEKNIFSDEEIEKLWQLVDFDETAAIVICLIYTGYRVTELLEMPVTNIDFEKSAIFGGGKKTKAGKTRVVPIHHRIAPLLKNLTLNKEVFYNYSYAHFSAEFKTLMKSLDFKHTIHETRHTTASLLSRAGVELNITKRILGHTFCDITEDVYIHKQLDELKNAIEILK